MHDRGAQETLRHRPRSPTDAAVRRALDLTESGQVETYWAEARGSLRPGVNLKVTEGMIVERRRVESTAAPERGVRRLCRHRRQSAAGTTPTGSGGCAACSTGSSAGAGMRRGRRSPDDLRPGDALDFWRVEAVEADRLVRLRAEMKTPGPAWLQFEVEPRAAGGTLLDPDGLLSAARPGRPRLLVRPLPGPPADLHGPGAGHRAARRGEPAMRLRRAHLVRRHVSSHGVQPKHEHLEPTAQQELVTTIEQVRLGPRQERRPALQRPRRHEAIIACGQQEDRRGGVEAAQPGDLFGHFGISRPEVGRPRRLRGLQTVHAGAGPSASCGVRQRPTALRLPAVNRPKDGLGRPKSARLSGATRHSAALGGAYLTWSRQFAGGPGLQPAGWLGEPLNFGNSRKRSSA